MKTCFNILLTKRYRNTKMTYTAIVYPAPPPTSKKKKIIMYGKNVV